MKESQGVVFSPSASDKTTFTSSSNKNWHLYPSKVILGFHLSWEEVAGSFVAAFEETLSLGLQRAELSPEEQNRSEELIHQKYGNREWTERM